MIVSLEEERTNAYNRYAMCPAGQFRVTTQEYLTLVPDYGKRNKNRRPPWIQ